jgi:hypothetical protein
MANNSYFMTDKEIDEVGKKIVSELYSNREIIEMKFNGRQLTGQLGALIERNISAIYSNIKDNKSLQHVLVNALRYSVLIEKNAILEAEIKKVRDACDRRKNMLLVQDKKLTTEPDNDSVKKEIEKIKMEISLLENQVETLGKNSSEPPQAKKNILELAKKAYKMLLRGDKTSEKLYVSVCKALNVKIEDSHFGYNVYNNYNNYHNNYQNNYQNSYKPYYNRFENTEEKKDIYVPPSLQHNYGGYRRKFKD